MLTAIAHIVGAIAVNAVIGYVLVWISSWEKSRNIKKEIEHLSVVLRLPIVELEARKHDAQVIEFQAERFSNEHLKNRLSDACGLIRTGWLWLGSVLQIVIFLGVIWFTVSDALSYAPFAWAANVLAIVFILVGVLFSLACHLLTGRWPGQAKSARADLGQIINEPKQEDLLDWDDLDR